LYGSRDALDELTLLDDGGGGKGLGLVGLGDGLELLGLELLGLELLGLELLGLGLLGLELLGLGDNELDEEELLLVGETLLLLSDERLEQLVQLAPLEESVKIKS
jgi:hypothetical protein